MDRKFVDSVRENALYYGITDAEIKDLFALILGSKATQEVCHQLASVSVRELLMFSAEDFMEFDGVGKVLAERLEAVITLAKKINEKKIPNTEIIRSPEDAYKVFEYLRHEQQEHFVALYLDTKNRIIGRKTIFKGSLNASVVHPREVFAEAVRLRAGSIIVGHNHPSGSPIASQEDVQVTRRLCESGKMLGIEILDHCIVGDGEFSSLKEKGHM